MAANIPIAGECDPRFSAVRLAFEQMMDSPTEVGAAVSVYRHRKPVVDLWGGYADQDQYRLWQPDTIVNVWSVTKAIVALCALRLVDKGQLSLDEPVARYWPEFAQAGKAQLPVRYLLNHQVGLPVIDDVVPPEAVFDWQRMTQMLAKQKPWWTPGTAFGYHAPTFGWLVGEVVRRVSHKRIGTFLQDEIARPLGIDFLIGFGPEYDERVATVVEQDPTQQDSSRVDLAIDPDSLQAKMNNPTFPHFSIFNSRAWRAAEIPSTNGTTNARALARLYGALACEGEMDGFRLLSQEILKEATSVSSVGTDIIFGFESCIGLGFALNRPSGFMGPNEAAFGHPGYGGSIGFADPTAGIGFGFVTNSIPTSTAQDHRAANLIRALYESL